MILFFPSEGAFSRWDVFFFFGLREEIGKTAENSFFRDLPCGNEGGDLGCSGPLCDIGIFGGAAHLHFHWKKNAEIWWSQKASLI